LPDSYFSRSGSCTRVPTLFAIGTTPCMISLRGSRWSSRRSGSRTVLDRAQVEVPLEGAMLGDVAQPALVGSTSGEAALDQVSWTGVTQEAPRREGVWWGAAASRWAWGDDAMNRTVSVRSPGRTGYPRGNRWHVGTTDLGRLARRITRNGEIRYPVGPGVVRAHAARRRSNGRPSRHCRPWSCGAGGISRSASPRPPARPADCGSAAPFGHVRARWVIP
jgi:hypothetical protein